MRTATKEEKIDKDGRQYLAIERPGVTLHFTIFAALPPKEDGSPNGVEEVDGYLTTGLYADGRLGEIFIRVAKEAAALGPMMDQWAIAFSCALQYGVSVNFLCKKFIASRFEPSGPVRGVRGIERCTSPVDLICRFLKERYGEKEEEKSEGQHEVTE